MLIPNIRRPLFYSLLALHSAVALYAAKPAMPAPDYKGAVVMDATSGLVLFEDNPDNMGPPASVTKLMTFLIVHDRIKAGTLSLDTVVTITPEESKIGGTQVWLKDGETFTIEELLYALMIQSANDAATALARAAAGSRAAFVELMNNRARELGMTNTKFRTPHGLPPATRKFQDSDLTTPHDLAVLSRELLLKTDVLKYASVKTRLFGQGQRAKPVEMINHNHLLGKIAGVDGLKTGFTNGAGFCLAATAERNNRRIIAVIMGSPERKTRDLKMAELLERGFTALPAVAASSAPAKPTDSYAANESPISPVQPAGSPVSPIAPAAPAAPEKPAPATKPEAKPAAEPEPTVKFVPPAKKS